MKKKIIKIISAICLATGIIALGTQSANAANYSDNGLDVLDFPFSTTLSIDSWQWFQRNDGTWGALTLDGHKEIASSWILYKDKWYYIDCKGYMVENAVVWGKDGNWYYMQDDGSMLTNGYASYQFMANKKSGPTYLYADANGVATAVK